MKFVWLGLLMVLLVAGGSVAAEEFPEEGEGKEEKVRELWSPSSPLFETNLMLEEAQYQLSEDPLSRAQMQDQMAERRMAALGAAEGDEAAEVLLSELEDHEGRIEEAIEGWSEENKQEGEGEESPAGSFSEGDQEEDSLDNNNGEDNDNKENNDNNENGENEDDIEDEIEEILEKIQENNSRRGERLADLVKDETMPETAREGALKALENQHRAMERVQENFPHGESFPPSSEEESPAEESEGINGEEESEKERGQEGDGTPEPPASPEKPENPDPPGQPGEGAPAEEDWNPGEGPPPWAEDSG